MRSLRTRIVIAALAFAVGVAAHAAWPPAGNGFRAAGAELAGYARARIPFGAWVPNFFRSINRHTDEAGLERLPTAALAGGDLEVRVWVGFGLDGEDALILRRASGLWSALRLHGPVESNRPPHMRAKVFAMRPPASGWEGAWRRLAAAGVMTLPDADAVRCRTRGLDGVGFVVEVKHGGDYRTYMYDNPNPSKCVEAARMIEIGRIVSEEFGLGEFDIND